MFRLVIKEIKYVAQRSVLLLTGLGIVASILCWANAARPAMSYLNLFMFLIIATAIFTKVNKLDGRTRMMMLLPLKLNCIAVFRVALVNLFSAVALSLISVVVFLSFTHSDTLMYLENVPLWFLLMVIFNAAMLLTEDLAAFAKINWLYRIVIILIAVATFGFYLVILALQLNFLSDPPQPLQSVVNVILNHHLAVFISFLLAGVFTSWIEIHVFRSRTFPTRGKRR